MSWSWDLSDRTRCIELGFVLDGHIPRIPYVPPVVVATTIAHRDNAFDDGSSGTAELAILGTHVGSHMDGFAHVAWKGRLRGGLAVEALDSASGAGAHDMTTVGPFIAPGFLIDLPATMGEDVVASDVVVNEDFLRVLPEGNLSGAIVLIRTGWGRLWARDARRYSSLAEHRPGLDRAAARWLASRGVRAVGTDSFTIEVSRPRDAGPVENPAHVELLVNAGIHIFESLALEELSAAGSPAFLFVALPLRLGGASGSPVRPVALI